MALHPRLELLEGLVESFVDAVLLCDREGVVIAANEAAARTLGVSRGDLPRPVGDLRPRLASREGLAPSFRPLVERALAGEVVAPVVQALAANDSNAGVARLRVTASPVRDDGAIVGSLVTVADVTAADERILDVSEARSDTRTGSRPAASSAAQHGDPSLHALFEAMPQLGWAADPTGWIYYYNRGWYEYTGTTPEQMEGWGWQSVHDPSALPAVVERWRAAIATGKPFEMAFPLRRHDGVFRWFLTRAVPLRDEDGVIVRWVGTNSDVHDQREARARLEALTDLALALSGAASRDDVAATVVDRGMRAAGADICTLYMLDPQTEALELIGQRGTAPEVLDRIRRITKDGSNPTYSAMAAGTSLWAEDEVQYAALFPPLSSMKATGPRAKAFWCAPLIVEGLPVGLLGMGFHQPRGFSKGERSFVEAFTNQCAQALSRAVRREREDTARQWLSTTLQSIGDAVIATDKQGRVTFMNPVAERLTGWPQHEAQGRPLAEVFAIFSEKTRAMVESPVTKVLREGTVVGLANHTILRSRGGAEIAIDDSGAPIRDASGTIFGVVLVFRDASVEKRQHVRREFLARAGETLASSLDYRATLATVARLAVPQLADWCTVDIQEPGASEPQQLAVAHADPTKVEYARALGQRYPPDPDASTGPPQVIRTGKAELYEEIPAALLEAGARDAEHLRILRELRLESVMVVPLRGRERNLGAMTFIYADSGRRYGTDDLAFAEDFARRAAMAIESALALRAAEEARAQERLLRAEAETANRTKDEFLATVSHELRTPLNAILGWTVTLRSRNPPPEIDRVLVVIERNARAQTRLVEDVLDVSRIISGKLSLGLGPTRIADAIEGAVEAVTPAADAKEVGLEVDIEDTSLVITADPDRLQQVVWNLIANAVKFTPKGGMVTVRAGREGPDVVLRVTDTGEGIRPDVLPHIFEAFRQADSSTTRRHGGLGLGLAIVKQIVVAHGGTVAATSEGEGRGATFTLRLPARSVVPTTGRPPRAATQTLPPSDQQPPRLDGLTLLVVDDEEDARDLVAEVLTEQGATVHVAGSGAEALQKFALVRPDVVVSDIGMPHIDGYSLIRKIRALPPQLGGRTPAVALTAYARKEDAQRAFAAGYQTHVAKPVEPVELATVIANLGGRSLDEAN
ncbi:MAG: PAS domain-containing protein [Myxococcota bacterium]|nr:PAS domain-containing protein [Myxococcota bacterium]